MNEDSRFFAPFVGQHGSIVKPIKTGQPYSATFNKMRISKCKALIGKFTRTGVYVSPTGGTLWVPEAWCRAKGIPFTVDRLMDGEAHLAYVLKPDTIALQRYVEEHSPRDGRGNKDKQSDGLHDQCP